MNRWGDRLFIEFLCAVFLVAAAVVKESPINVSHLE